MGRFDRYMLSRMLTLFGFFALVLVLIYWINNAVQLFDQLIADGQSTLVFLEFSALTIPSVILRILPIAAFAAALYATDRLAADSELVVVQATGFSPFRLARPAMVYALITALFTAVLANYLVPTSLNLYYKRIAEVSESLTARLFTEGEFLTPVDGVTVFIRDVTPQGELVDIFVSDARDSDVRHTYTASRAYLVRHDEKPQLVMIDGMAQSLRLATDSLLITRFDDFSYDLSAFVTGSASRKIEVGELTTAKLLRADSELSQATGLSIERLNYLGHERIALSGLTIAACMIGFATLLLGGFSRFGVWRQMVFAVFLIILVKLVDSSAISLSAQYPQAWAVAYVPSLFGFTIVWIMLSLSGRPFSLGALIRRASS